MSPLLRKLFVVLVAYPVTLFWLGLVVRHRERLPLSGPAIIVANHNSHLDILALYSLFPMRVIPSLRPAAAADYFLRRRGIAWLAQNLVGIVPVERGAAQSGRDPLDECHAALNRGEIVIIFPEGTRGEPETLAGFKAGIWHLLKRFPDVPVTPVFMWGLGRSMPKGGIFPLPLFVDILVGRALAFDENKSEFMQHLTETFLQLRARVVSDRRNNKENPDAQGY